MPAGPHFVTQLKHPCQSENIPNIWHKSSTKHGQTNWNDKNDNANYAPSYHMEGFTNAQVPFLKKNIRSSAKDLDCELFYSELERHNVTLYLLSYR